ncbi:glyoxalase [Agromyces sp. LHK192]|uniref:glyoxalase n=1 Tax=Agromyces sp. LHK192 TaxID=2498704 RepID=UPI000FD7B5BC|nr:glyoxalase [Agromyces sp. LHK192]
MNTITDTSIESITIEAADPDATREFLAAAFGLGGRIRVRRSEAPTTGFRGFTVSLIVAQPSTVHSLVGTALAAGAVEIKPVAKSMWGVGGTVQAPDGTVWKVATSAKKDTGPATREVEKVVILLGAEDVGASKRFYLDRGFTVDKSFGSYVEFETPGSPIGLGLYRRRALAKDAGVDESGSGSHRVVISGPAGTDPDGFAWEPNPSEQ